MELESLKYIWRNLDTPAARQPDAELLALLQKRSRGPVARMRRNLLAELILILITYIPTVLFYWIDFGGRLAPVGWLMLLVMLFYGGYFYRKNRLLRQMQCVQCEVRSNLERQVTTLKKYIRFYLLTGTFIVPVIVILSWLIIHWQYPHWWAHPLPWLLMLIPFTIGSYYANACYINKLYGRHIRKLQELLQEMNEE